MMYKEINSSRLLYKIDSYSGGIAVSPVMPSTYSGGDKDFKAAFLKNAQKADAKKDAKDEEVLLENVEYENSKIEDEFVRDEAAAFGAEKAVEFDKFQSEKSDKLESAKHAGGAQASAFVIDSSEQAVVTSYGSTSSGDAYEPDPVPDPNSSTPPSSDLKSKLANIDYVNTNLGVLILLFLANEVYPEQYKALNAQNLINLSLLQVQSEWLTLTAVTVSNKCKDIMDKSNQAALDSLIGACVSMGVSLGGALMQSWSHWKTFNANKDNGLAQESALAHQLKTSMDSHDILREKMPESLKNIKTLRSELAADNNVLADEIDAQKETFAKLNNRTKRAGDNQAVAKVNNSNAVEQEVVYVKELGDIREESATGTAPLDFMSKEGVNTAILDDQVLAKDREDYANLPKMNAVEFKECLKKLDGTGINSQKFAKSKKFVSDYMKDGSGNPVLISKEVAEGGKTSTLMLNADEDNNCYLIITQKTSDQSPPTTILRELGKSEQLGGWIRARQNNKSFMLDLKVNNPSVKTSYYSKENAQLITTGRDNARGLVDTANKNKQDYDAKNSSIQQWRNNADGLFKKADQYVAEVEAAKRSTAQIPAPNTGKLDLDEYIDGRPAQDSDLIDLVDDQNMQVELGTLGSQNTQNTQNQGPAGEFWTQGYQERNVASNRNLIKDKCIKLTKPTDLEPTDLEPNDEIGFEHIAVDPNTNSAKLEFAEIDERPGTELDDQLTRAKYAEKLERMKAPTISKGELDKFTEKLYRAERLRPEMENYKTTMLDQLRIPQDGAATGTMYSKITNSKNAARHPAEQWGVLGGALVGAASGINGIASYFSQTTQAEAENERTILNSTTQIYGSEEQIAVQLMHTISGYVSTAWQNLVQTVGELMQSAVQDSQFMH
ncbi:MAG: hypothetical protein QG673_1616 [Pseudomonadota bacterium]|nr:hypothetical protein [Pseudomonadota bacterium]